MGEDHQQQPTTNNNQPPTTTNHQQQTTTNKKDDQIVSFCREKNLEFFRGSEDDLLSRYKMASDAVSADVVVRLVSDCPLIDPLVIDKVINAYLNNNYDYVSNCYPLPRTYPEGYSVEVFSAKILDHLFYNALKPSDREHVTFSLWMQQKKYSAHRVDYERDLSDYRLNLDYQEDYILIKSVFEALYPKNPFFTMEDIIKWLDSHPQIFQLNRKNPSYENILQSFEIDKQKGFKSSKKFFKN